MRQMTRGDHLATVGAKTGRTHTRLGQPSSGRSGEIQGHLRAGTWWSESTNVALRRRPAPDRDLVLRSATETVGPAARVALTVRAAKRRRQPVPRRQSRIILDHDGGRTDTKRPHLAPQPGQSANCASSRGGLATCWPVDLGVQKTALVIAGTTETPPAEFVPRTAGEGHGSQENCASVDPVQYVGRRRPGGNGCLRELRAVASAVPRTPGKAATSIPKPGPVLAPARPERQCRDDACGA